MATFTVDLVSVERPMWSGEANAVYARTTVGEFGILPGHVPMLGQLDPQYGVVRVERDGEADLVIAAHGGFISVSDNGVSILAEMAELADEIDVERARAALDRARGNDSDPNSDAAAERAMLRLRAAGQPV